MLKKKKNHPSSKVIFTCKDDKQQKVLISEQAFVFLKEYLPSVLNINTITFGEQKFCSIQR